MMYCAHDPDIGTNQFFEAQSQRLVLLFTAHLNNAPRGQGY